MRDLTKRVDAMPVTRVVVLLGLVFSASGCNLGVRGLQRDYSAFSDTIRQLEDEQLLTNLLRIRYVETPIFLQIASITTTYGFSASTNLAGIAGTGGAGAVTAGAGTGYSETPTIGYSIPDSRRVYGSILAPLRANQVTSVGRSGAGIILMLRICTKRINRLENISFYENWEPVRPATYGQFQEMLALMTGLWEAGAIDFAIGNRFSVASSPLETIDNTRAIPHAQEVGVEFYQDDEGQWRGWKGQPYLQLRFHADADASPEAKRLRELLGLSTEQHSFAMIDAVASNLERKRLFENERAAAMDPTAEFDEIVLQNRSLYEILTYASLWIDVPDAHVDAGITVPRSESFHGWFTVRHSLEEPQDVAIKVLFKGYWFYVAEDDLFSKNVIGILNTLFASTTGNVPGPQPVLTVPVR